MDVAAWVREHGGVVRSAAVIGAGGSRRTIATAQSTGGLQRPRRGWLAVPDADPYLVAAARAGVVLSCVTQARRLGLWVLHEPKPHVAASAHSGSVRVKHDDPDDGSEPEPKAVVHWARPLVPRDPAKLADPIENVLAFVAACRPFEEALIVWESALRRELVDRRALERLPLGGPARRLLDAASLYSDSGLETLIVPRLGWLRIRIVAQAWILGHRVDFLIGDRLVLQIDGGTHVGAQREEDVRHDAALMLVGYHVIRVGYFQVIDDWPGVQDLIMRAVAQGLHRAA